MSLAFWGLVALTGAVYLAMVLWTLPAIQAAAGGLVAFDLRPRGYTLAEAQAFLGALSDEGRALYLGAQHKLDTAFPGLLAVTVAWAYWRLTDGIPAWVRAVLVPLPFAAAAFDYLENARVRGMLLADPAALTEGMVAAANSASVGKAVLSTVAYTVLLGLILWRAKRWLRR